MMITKINLTAIAAIVLNSKTQEHQAAWLRYLAAAVQEKKQ